MEDIINEIKALAVTYDIEKVILFGSRAKGTHNKNSDYDIAVIGKNYVDFNLALTYETNLLSTFDIHNYSKISDSFRKEIDKTGMVIYEKV